MITILVDLKATVSRPRIGKRLGSSDKQALTEKISITPIKEKILSPLISKRESENVQAKEPETTGEDLIKGYDDLQTRSEGILGLVKRRLKYSNLFMPINALTDPVNAEYLRRMFSGNPTGISFDMYLKLIEYRHTLDAALAEVQD